MRHRQSRACSPKHAAKTPQVTCEYPTARVSVKEDSRKVPGRFEDAAGHRDLRGEEDVEAHGALVHALPRRRAFAHDGEVAHLRGDEEEDGEDGGAEDDERRARAVLVLHVTEEALLQRRVKGQRRLEKAGEGWRRLEKADTPGAR